LLSVLCLVVTWYWKQCYNYGWWMIPNFLGKSIYIFFFQYHHKLAEIISIITFKMLKDKFGTRSLRHNTWQGKINDWFFRQTTRLVERQSKIWQKRRSCNCKLWRLKTIFNNEGHVGWWTSNALLIEWTIRFIFIIMNVTYDHNVAFIMKKVNQILSQVINSMSKVLLVHNSSCHSLLKLQFLLHIL